MAGVIQDERRKFQVTNWDLIRDLMNTAIDTCEAIEQLQISEQDRSKGFEKEEIESAKLWDFLQSSWIAPENLSYSVIRARHQLGQDAPYINELSRILIQVGRLSSELVGVEDSQKPVEMSTPFRQTNEQSIETMVQDLCSWYRDFLVPSANKIMDRDNG